jgi:transcriptional repressor NrdR
MRTRGSAEVPSRDVRPAILGPPRDVNEIAYVRFASVYRSFDSLADSNQETATAPVREVGRTQ